MRVPSQGEPKVIGRAARLAGHSSGLTHRSDWCEVGMVQDLTEMVGALLLVGVTYVDGSGDIESRIEFAGRVLAVSPLVSIELAGAT
jgi:hypothetical protein